MLEKLFGKRRTEEEVAEATKPKKPRGAHLKNYGGRRSRTIRQGRIDAILLHLFWFHFATADVLLVLTGAKKITNAGILSELEAQHLIQGVKNNKTPEILWMLTENGVARVLKSWQWDELNRAQWPHPYNSKPESVRYSQLEHDLTVARWAAQLVHDHRVTIIGTDFSGRSDPQPGRKLADFIFQAGHIAFVVEYERTVKSQRDVEIALARLYDAGRITAIVCAQPHILARWREVLNQDQLPIWERHPTTNRWYQTQGRITPSPEQKRLVKLVSESEAQDWLGEKATVAKRIQR